ncbi:MAG: nucleotidyltransferase family protein [Armatimonadetes bacterium]|nr:nucleotidyltransferase family protein [Armatimonadota bacterium]
MQAVVLTAGRGDRLRPVTDHIPKALIPFWGKPFVAYLLDSLVGLVDEAVIVVSSDGRVRDALGDDWQGLPLHYVVQPCPGGTGDALLHAQDVLDERFLLMLGDTLPPRDTVRELLACEDDAVLTLVEVDDPYNHGAVGIHDGLVVERLWVKDSNLVDGGMSVLPRSICNYLHNLEPMRGELRVLQGVDALLRDGHRVRGVKLQGPWLQYGDHEGASGVCRVMNEMRPYTEGADAGRDSSVSIRHQNCEIVNSLVFGPGELINCSIRDSLVYCATRVSDASVHNAIVAWT